MSNRKRTSSGSTGRGRKKKPSGDTVNEGYSEFDPPPSNNGTANNNQGTGNAALVASPNRQDIQGSDEGVNKKKYLMLIYS